MPNFRTAFLIILFNAASDSSSDGEAKKIISDAITKIPALIGAKLFPGANPALARIANPPSGARVAIKKLLRFSGFGLIH